MISKDRGKLWHYAGPPIGFNSSLADNTPPTLWPNSLKYYADSETSTFDTTFEPPQMTSNPEDHTDVGIRCAVLPWASKLLRQTLKYRFFPDLGSAFEPQIESNHQECADEWTRCASLLCLWARKLLRLTLKYRSFRAFGSGMQPPQMGANLEVYTDEGASFLPDVGLVIEPQMESNPQAYANEGTRLFLPVGDDIESLQMESDPQAYADEGPVYPLSRAVPSHLERKAIQPISIVIVHLEFVVTIKTAWNAGKISHAVPCRNILGSSMVLRACPVKRILPASGRTVSW
ncbi:hypothetical protein BKA82DRAFT_2550328 [Pisolithus tinctorius]|nr:hypothetical protein BKA82DRAFT_2550328 [Pisolithus tinctorius]